MAGNFFVMNKNMNMKKDNENSRPTKLGSHLLRTVSIHSGYQCVTQLSLSRVVVFFLLFAAVMPRYVFSKC